MTGPMLEISLVLFYRPVALAILHIEYLAWGVEPLAYLLTSFVVHCLNVLLVFMVMRNMMRKLSAWYAVGVSLIFAIYPIHPNTVSFIAATTALFCTTFLLGAFLQYQKYEQRKKQFHLVASAALFCAALGCYEQAVVFPLMIVSLRILKIGIDDTPISRSDILGWAVLISLLIAYLFVRYLALGEFEGGYRNSLSLIDSRSAQTLIYNFFVNFVHIINPNWLVPIPAWLSWCAGLLLLATFLLNAFKFRGNQLAVLFNCSVIWVILGQLPFLFYTIVPGAGRYWYLPSVGVGLFIVISVVWLARVITVWLPRNYRPTVAIILLMVVASYYFGLLQYYSHEYQLAGLRTQQIQKKLGEIVNNTDDMVFVRGHPAHHRDENGNPIAQVFHWGLSDSVKPPFLPNASPVYPLLQSRKGDLLPVSSISERAQLWEWDHEQEQFLQIHTNFNIEKDNLKRIEVLDLGSGQIRISVEPGTRYDLIVAGEANMSRSGIDLQSKMDRSVLVEIPQHFVASNKQLYAGGVYFWIEGRARNKQLNSISDMYKVQEPDSQVRER